MSGMDDDSIEREINDAFDGEDDEMDRLIDLKSNKSQCDFYQYLFCCGIDNVAI